MIKFILAYAVLKELSYVRRQGINMSLEKKVPCISRKSGFQRYLNRVNQLF